MVNNAFLSHRRFNGVRHADLSSDRRSGSLGRSDGNAVSGEALPSVRSLAEQLVINFNTVSKGYAELVREGILESLQGKGFFVAHKRQIYSRAERLRRLRHAVDNFIHEAVFLDFSAEEICKAVDEKLAELGWQSKTVGEKT
jgi:GntR family transcriptional regulator